MTKNEVHQMVAMLQPVLKLPAAGETPVKYPKYLYKKHMREYAH